MKVLVIGSGGREHALVWKISESPHVDKIYAAPGNAGMVELAECVPVKPDDTRALLELAVDKDIDITVVGPEVPLVAGIADMFASESRRIFGFGSSGAVLEGSKVKAKKFMKKYGVPTGDFAVFTEYAEARDAVSGGTPPLVVKADGLAAGKGVLVCKTAREAEEAIDKIMVNRVFGDAGDSVIVEEHLSGPEVSILSVYDGKDYRLFVPSQDHKRALDGDMGPNTGGMGAYAPVNIFDGSMEERVRREIVEPTFEGMEREGMAGAGVLYFGLMLTGDGPKVLEYNCRFGDPETQVILPLFRGDLFEVMFEATSGNLESVDFENGTDSAACVVVASGGYPASYKKGFEIKGIGAAEEAGCMVFHAGTALSDGKLVTSGGRVLGVTAVAKDLERALERAYSGVDSIEFEDCFSRRDIGKRGLR